MPDLNELTLMATEVIAAWTPRVVGALLALIFGWMFAGWMKRLVRKALFASQLDDMLVPFIAGMIHVTIIVIVAIAAVGVLGVSTASFVAVLGAAGLAIALAFQGTFSNFAAGVMLLTFRPFDVGHFVEVGGSSGTVKEVGIFTCLLATPDNIQIRVPNNEIFGATIKNFSANDTRRIDLVIGVSYDDDIGTAIRACKEVLDADSRILDDPEPFIAVGDLGASSVDILVRPWVNAEDFFATKTDLLRALKEKLEGAGCSLPYPQRDIHLHQVAS